MSARWCTLGVLAGAMTLVAVIAGAQDRPTVFMHGFGAEASDWAATAERLRHTVAIDPHIPSLNWRMEFEKQAADVQSRAEFFTLPANAVAVGHSNGGVVAREWSKLHRLNGIVTIGTPHQGVPILPHLALWWDFASGTRGLLSTAVGAFSVWSDWTWTYAYVEGLLHWASDFGVWSVLNMVTTLGLNAAMPVSPEMWPGSPYLLTLNSSANLSREAAEIPGRVGIVSIAHDFYFAGPARAIAPDAADGIAVALYGAAFGLVYWSNYILLDAPPTDIAANDQSLALLGVAGQLLSIDPYYCHLISTVDMSQCAPNDGIVPVTSQAYPGAPNLIVGANNDGPAHKQEKQQSDDALYQALVWYLHVPARTPAPPPLPQPPPSPPAPDPLPVPSPDPPSLPPDTPPVPTPDPPIVPPDPPPAPAPNPPSLPPDTPPAPTPNPPSLPPDPLPAPSPDPPGLPPDEPPDLPPDPAPVPPAPWPGGPRTITSGLLLGGDLVLPGDEIRSYDGRFRLDYQRDGNLVLYDVRHGALWSTRTSGTSPGWVVMQRDGNLVLYGAAGSALWSTASPGHPDARLVVQNDGNLVVYAPDNRVLWFSGTNGH